MKLSLLGFTAILSAFSASQNWAQQGTHSVGSFSHPEVLLAKTSFIDVGPPFDFYTLYRLTHMENGTDVERLSITPAAGSCALPTSDSAHAHLTQSLSDLFQSKDPCSIAERVLRREAKRCKHCLVFSGVHVTAQLTCSGKQRTFRYEVLDRDLFDPQASAPKHTSSTLQLLTKLDEAFGSSDFDRPLFVTEESDERSSLPSQGQSALAQSVQAGAYDGLFGEKVSLLYKASLNVPRRPQVELLSSTPAEPLWVKLPAYPAIARAAHVEGVVKLQLNVSKEGTVTTMKWLNGQELLRQQVSQAARNWKFAPTEEEHRVEVVLRFNLNCPDASLAGVSR